VQAARAAGRGDHFEAVHGHELIPNLRRPTPARASARRRRRAAAGSRRRGGTLMAPDISAAPPRPTRRMSERPVAGSRIRPTCTAAGAARSPPAHLPPGTPHCAARAGRACGGIKGSRGRGAPRRRRGRQAVRACPGPRREGLARQVLRGSTGLRGRLAGQRCGHLGRRGSAGRGGGEARAPMGRGALSGISLCGRYGSSILRGALQSRGADRAEATASQRPGFDFGGLRTSPPT